MSAQPKARLKLTFGLIGLLALAGAITAGQLAWTHASGAETCPMLGPLPACYLVLAGYSVMVAASISRRGVLFVAGLVPVLALATIGVVGEFISDTPVCPQTAGGIPKCYFSFAFASALALLGGAAFLRRSK